MDYSLGQQNNFYCKKVKIGVRKEATTQGCQMAKFDPFHSLDCAGMEILQCCVLEP